MRFLIDESADARLAAHLLNRGHDATLIAVHHGAGLPDAQVLAIAVRENRILVTDDRDFGERIVRHREAHKGVIFFRLRNTLLSTRTKRLDEVLEKYPNRLDEFIVVTDRRERFR